MTDDDGDGDDADPREGEGERENATVALSDLVARVVANVERNIAAKEAAGEPVGLPPEDPAEVERAKLRRLIDRQIPQRPARILVNGELELATPAMQVAQRFMAGPPGSLVISGGVGCGKTLAAAWCVAQKVRDRYFGNHPDGKDGTWPADLHPRYVDAAKLARLPRWSGKGEAAAALAPYETCSVLAIDDVGLEADAGFVAILDALVVARHEDGLRTVMTMNMTAETFREVYKARVADRVDGSGGFYSLNGSSRRRRDNQ